MWETLVNWGGRGQQFGITLGVNWCKFAEILVVNLIVNLRVRRGGKLGVHSHQVSGVYLLSCRDSYQLYWWFIVLPYCVLPSLLDSKLPVAEPKLFVLPICFSKFTTSFLQFTSHSASSDEQA